MKIAFLQIILCWVIVVFSLTGIGKVIKGEDNNTREEWTTQLLYDTTNACYAGTLRWIILANPLLLGQPPPPLVQRQIIQHCFCVMDKIRKQYNHEKYVELVTSGISIGQLFMDKSHECMNEFDTMRGIFITKDQLDNSTMKDNETEVIPAEPEGLDESTPDEELEQEQSIFKG